MKESEAKLIRLEALFNLEMGQLKSQLNNVQEESNRKIIGLEKEVGRLNDLLSHVITGRI